MARYSFEFCAIESCGKCTPCRIGSTRGMEVIDKIKKGIDQEKNVMLLRDLGDTMAFSNSMRQFYATANTQVPNDQKAFLDFCYKNM